MEAKDKILIVEDEDQLRKILSRQLSENGYEVREASSGNEAIPLTYGVGFNLVVLDLKMEYIDGFEYLKFVKGSFPGTKVIVLTAYGDLMNYKRCKEMGADEFISKPYDCNYLFYMIELLLRDRKSQPEGGTEPFIQENICFPRKESWSAESHGAKPG